MTAFTELYRETAISWDLWTRLLAHALFVHRVLRRTFDCRYHKIEDILGLATCNALR